MSALPMSDFILFLSSHVVSCYRGDPSSTDLSKHTRGVLLLEFVKGIDDAYTLAEVLHGQNLPLLQVGRHIAGYCWRDRAVASFMVGRIY